jgi:release factor glutamine methyltransferase
MNAPIRKMLEVGATRLAALGESPVLDAQVLMAHVFGQSRTWVLAHATDTPDPAQTQAYEDLLTRLESGEPLPYVLGRHEFFGLEFELTPDVLIPRPETELLVQKALNWMEGAPDRRTFADVGTGSGCIAISLAFRVADARCMATDISPAALNVARQNARKHGVADRINFIECDILPSADPSLASEQLLDLVCANLPYIPSAQLRSLPIFGHEPTLALDGGPDGLDPFRRFFSLAPAWLAPGGLMLLEIESSSGPAVLSLAYDAFHEAAFHLHRDLAGRDRLLEIQLNSSA